MTTLLKNLFRIGWGTWRVYELSPSLYFLEYNYRGTWYINGEYNLRKYAHEAFLERVL